MGAQGSHTGLASGLRLLLLYKYRNLKSGTGALAEQILLRAQRGRSRRPEQLYPYMVAERGPLVKAQLSNTHALCSHAPDKKQNHAGWYLKEGLRDYISIKELPNNFSDLHQESLSPGKQKKTL